MNNNIIIFKNISKLHRKGFFRKKTVGLKDINLQIGRGDIVGYLGPNGAGKTTTFKILLGLLRANEGEVRVDGELGKMNSSRKIGYLPESPYFYPHLTGEEALLFCGKLCGMSGNVLKDRVEELLQLVGLDDASKKRLNSYSRGMLQRIGFAQALINDPEILLLDEPMSGLDPYGRKEMRDIMLSCKEEGKTILFSTHILADVEMVCDKAVIINNGEIRNIINVSDILDRTIKYWEIRCSHINDTILNNLKTEDVEMLDSENHLILKIKTEKKANEIVDQLVKEKSVLISYNPQRENLEDIFLKYND